MAEKKWEHRWKETKDAKTGWSALIWLKFVGTGETNSAAGYGRREMVEAGVEKDPQQLDDDDLDGESRAMGTIVALLLMG
jgi:hypothetical protein